MEGLSLLLVLFSSALSYRVSNFFMGKTKVFGTDVHKKSRPVLPEGVGLGPGLCFIAGTFVLALLYPASKTYILLSGCTVSLNVLLGYVDDTMELSWLFKLVFPCVAIMPMIISYDGSTYLDLALGYSCDLRGGFHLSLVVLSVFFTNSINILSGINGVESGQVLVVAGAAVLDRVWLSGRLGPAGSMCGLLFGCTASLFHLNKYPARCLVGDTFCYFAGAALLCAGVLGGFTKTIFLFFAPEALNLLLSLPQLLGVIECPRHRMPWMEERPRPTPPHRRESKTHPSRSTTYEVLTPSMVEITLAGTGKTSGGSAVLLRGAARALLVKIGLGVGLAKRVKGNSVSIPNLTLLNVLLYYLGEAEEQNLTYLLMCMQALWCATVIVAKWILK